MFPTVIVRLRGWCVETGSYLITWVLNCLWPYLLWSFGGLLNCYNESRKDFISLANCLQINYISSLCSVKSNDKGLAAVWAFEVFVMWKAVRIHLFCVIGFLMKVLFSLCVWQLAPTSSVSLVNSMKIVENPVATCDQVYALIQSLTSQIRKRMEDPKSAGEQKSSISFKIFTFNTPHLNCNETVRWPKIKKTFSHLLLVIYSHAENVVLMYRGFKILVFCLYLRTPKQMSVFHLWPSKFWKVTFKKSLYRINVMMLYNTFYWNLFLSKSSLIYLVEMHQLQFSWPILISDFLKVCPADSNFLSLYEHDL